MIDEEDDHNEHDHDNDEILNEGDEGVEFTPVDHEV